MVKFINYKGEKLPFRVGYYVIKKLKENGKSLEDIEKGEFEVYEDLLYYALIQGHKIQEKEFNLKREDMEDVLDICFTEFIPQIPDFFQGLEGVAGTGKTKTQTQAKTQSQTKKNQTKKK